MKEKSRVNKMLKYCVVSFLFGYFLVSMSIATGAI